LTLEKLLHFEIANAYPDRFEIVSRDDYGTTESWIIIAGKVRIRIYKASLHADVSSFPSYIARDRGIEGVTHGSFDLHEPGSIEKIVGLVGEYA